MFSQRILVALDTGRGVVYAPASGWDRIHILWMFRNFRSLPQTVLSARQKQLVGSLYRQASNHQSQDLYDAVVIGRVEDFSPSALPMSTTPAKASKPLLGTRRDKSEKDKSEKLQSDANDQGPLPVRFAFNRAILKAGAGALVALIAILAWHQLGAQPISRSFTEKAALALPSDESKSVAKDPAVEGLGLATVQSPSGPVALQPSPVSSTGPELLTTSQERTMAAAIDAKPLPEASTVPSEPKSRMLAANAAVRNDRPARVHASIAAPPSPSDAAADQPRMRISGRPRKLVYPICPQTRARGQVSLQAVVGYDGAVSRVKVLTGDRMLAAAAVEAVRQWRYEPFSGPAQGVERETTITVSFISNEVVAVSFPAAAPLSR